MPYMTKEQAAKLMAQSFNMFDDMDEDEAALAIKESQEKLAKVEAALAANNLKALAGLGCAFKEQTEDWRGLGTSYGPVNKIAIDDLRKTASMTPKQYAGWINGAKDR